MFSFSFFTLIIFAHFIFKAVHGRIIYKGADISSLLKMEAAGQTFKNQAGVSLSLERILADAGANTIRQRLMINPRDKLYDLEYNIKLAKRVKAAGMQIYLDIFFSSDWTDPSRQATPSDWAKETIDDLCKTVSQYTRTVSNTFAQAGIYPVIISLGNEIQGGILFPVGAISKPGNTARLLHSASAGIRASALSTRGTKIMIHTSNGWDKETQLWFYKTILSSGPFTLKDFDIMGFSFYGILGPKATFSALRDTFAALENTYPGKELVVVETDWPVSCPTSKVVVPSDSSQIRFSSQGQIEWVQKIVNVLKATASGAGYFYWEAAWVSNANLGTSCADNLLFGPDGKARDSVKIFSLA